MWRANIKNRSFDHMGEEWAPVIDPNHFLGRSSFDIPYPKSKKAPPASLVREGELLVLEIVVTDYKKEELEVEVNHDILFVSGKKEGKPISTKSEHVSQELHRDTFERVFKLAPSIAREGVEANFKAGVLRIEFYDVPTEEETVHRKVAIQETV